MIIDIMDTNFEKININKLNVSNTRYARGIEIYDSERVSINNVNKISDSSYYIEANVKGNNGIYSVNLAISNDKILECLCTCQDFQKGYKCKHIIATIFETKYPHRPNTEEGRRKLAKKEEEKRKRYEYEIKYQNCLELLNIYKDDSKNLKKETIDLAKLYNETIKKKEEKRSDLATSIKIEYNIKFLNNKSIEVSFKIGERRMYLLNNFCDFYEACKNENELYFGKQLRCIPKRENFVDDSKKLFDFIMKYAKNAEYNKKVGNYDLYNVFNKSVFLMGDDIDNFFDLLKNEEIGINTYTGIKKFKFSNKKLELYCTLKKEELNKSKEYSLKLNINNFIFLESYKKVYIFNKEEIYVIEKDKKLIETLSIFNNNDEIIIPEDKLDEFKKVIFPKIKRVEIKDLPENVENNIKASSKLASKILLDLDEDGNILLELKFCYNNYEFNILENGYEKYVKEHNINRDINAEEEIIRRIFNDGFISISNQKEFILSNLDDIYDFLSNKIEGYMNDFEVLVTDKFKKMKIIKPKILNIGIKIDNGLLELDISKININLNEIKNILKCYKIKKKYYKLKSGEFLNLENNKDLNLLDEVSTTLDIDYSEMKNGIINLPVNRSLYLSKLIKDNNDINVSKDEGFTRIVDNIENINDTIDDYKLDKKIEEKLRDYQKIGFKWLKTLEKYKMGGILADDMGLGKTLQIIALLKSEIEEKNKVISIVVCPSTLVLNWKAEVEKWSNSIKVLIVSGNAEERNKKINDYKNYDLLITSYDLLKRDIDNYKNINFKFIIADEAQYIKNSTTKNATAVKKLKGETKFALTGTPIENSVSELWSIFDFIMPGYLYNYNKFKKKFEEPILKNQDEKILKKLKMMISPFVLRRVKKDVLAELPEKNITIIKNEMEDEQQKIYLSFLTQTKKFVKELDNNSFEKNKLKIFELLMRLRQICCHPGLFLENYNGGSGKLKQCIDLVKDAIESDHKILIFSTYTSMFEIIEKELDKLDIKYFKLVGETPVSKRIDIAEEFNSNDEVKVFLISLKAGGTGLNLTSADVVIHYDPWWNVSSENQATDRAYRIGQKNSVQVYKLITSNSIEEKIIKIQERKEKLSKDILSTKEKFINKMSKEEILELFN